MRIYLVETWPTNDRIKIRLVMQNTTFYFDIFFPRLTRLSRCIFWHSLTIVEF